MPRCFRLLLLPVVKRCRAQALSRCLRATTDSCCDPKSYPKATADTAKGGTISRHSPQNVSSHAYQTHPSTPARQRYAFLSDGRAFSVVLDAVKFMPFPGGGTGSAQDLEAGETAWVDQELIGASGSSFGDLPPAAGPSARFDDGGINGGSTSCRVEATVVELPAPDVKPVKRKKRGWKGWAVVTQDEHGNLIEMNDELPDGVRIKPIRAPASATIRVGAQQGSALASGSLQSDQLRTSSPVLATLDETGPGDRVSGLNGTSRQPRRAAAMAHVAPVLTPPSRRGSPKPRSTTPASSIPTKKRKRASEIPPIIAPKKYLHRPANRGVSLPSSEAPLSPALRRALSPDLRKTLAASALDHAQAPLKNKGKGKGKEREIGPESPEPPNGSSSRRPSTASTSLVDLHELRPEIEDPESREQPTSPLRLGMGVYQPPPKLSALRSQIHPSSRPVSPAPERWRALPPEVDEPDLLLYVPAVLPEDFERPVPHPSYLHAKRGPREDISTFELQHENGLSGISLAMERDAVGFLNNVKANLQTLLQYACPQPTVARTAFVERLGRGLQEIGWTMTDEGDI